VGNIEFAIVMYQAGTMMNKKELIRQYKETVQPMGIYQIRNAENGKRLIGSARNLNGMLNRHKFQLENNLHGNRDLQREFNEAGGRGFFFEILDRLEPRDDPGYDYSEELKVLEEIWIDRLTPFHERGYNKTPSR
jgi:hypothetical protein